MYFSLPTPTPLYMGGQRPNLTEAGPKSIFQKLHACMPVGLKHTPLQWRV